MKRFLQISIVYILFLHPLAGKAFTNSFQQLNLPNATVVQDTIKENQLIQQVIHSKKNPTKKGEAFRPPLFCELLIRITNSAL